MRRKLLVAAVGIASASFGCTTSQSTVGNAMANDCGACTPPDTGVTPRPDTGSGEDVDAPSDAGADALDGDADAARD